MVSVPKREEIHRHLRMYSELGWPVFPVVSNRKTPALVGWQKAASSNPKQLEEWFSGPPLNVGVLTGTPSGFFVLDVDPRNGGDVSLDDMQRSIGGFPDTVIQQTPGGG